MTPVTANTSVRLWAIVPAAGAGTRMQAGKPKQYLPLAGQCLLDHTLARLLRVPGLTGVVVALSKDDNQWPMCIHARHPRVTVVPGGATRADSVLAALDYLAVQGEEHGWVLVHDAARPCVTPGCIERLLAAADTEDGAILARPLTDTVKRARGEVITETLDRGELWGAQTPQLFPRAALRAWLAQALAEGLAVTDEASAAEYAGKQPRLVLGRSDNIKITHPEDMVLAEAILAWQQREGVA